MLPFVKENLEQPCLDVYEWIKCTNETKAS